MLEVAPQLMAATGGRLSRNDRVGLAGPGRHPESWKSAHGSRGCTPAGLKSTGGNGYFYCFAVQ